MQRPNPEPDSADPSGLTDQSQPDSANATETADSDQARSERSVFDEPAAEDRDTGWGDHDREDGRSDEWYRRERPPHHG